MNVPEVKKIKYLPEKGERIEKRELVKKGSEKKVYKD